MQDYNLIIQLPRHFTGLVPSIYQMDRPFDLYSYYTKISLVVLPLDALNLCVLRGIVLLRKHAHRSYTYIPPPVQRGYRKQTYLIYYMLDILFTLCVIIFIYKLRYSGYLFALVASNMNPNISSISR
jgi:hypothetical protein